MDYSGFNPSVQALAASGFAVLQVNYRGSSGYGKEFRDAGRLEWGKGIEDDIDAAVDRVVNEGWADARCMCVTGASYGGYSALMSLVRHPDRFRCAAVFAAVTDIPLLFDGVRDAFRQHLAEIVGDPAESYEEMRALSPVYNSEKIRVPLQLVHGRLDRRVDIEHAQRLNALLELRGAEVDWRPLDGVGHSFDDPEQTVSYLESLASFMEGHLGPASCPPQ